MHSGNSQTTDFNGENTPHSPKVSSLGKKIDHPVDYQEAYKIISVPVYTLTEGDLSLPIILCSEGIKKARKIIL